MSGPLIDELNTWSQGLQAFKRNDYDQAVYFFRKIEDRAVFFFNIGIIQAALGRHHEAIKEFDKAVARDAYMAVAYFQKGVSHFQLGAFYSDEHEEELAHGHFGLALPCFETAFKHLRGNFYIDYTQLGLEFQLYDCEVLFNRGICWLRLQQQNAGLADLRLASERKRKDDHRDIDTAISELGHNYRVYSVHPGHIFEPPPAKLRNATPKQWLGQSQLVAVQDQSARYRGRSRQQSEPPLQRNNVFPPTPPPELERADSFHDTSQRLGESPASDHSFQLPSRLAVRPPRLELGTAASEQRDPSAHKSRLGPKRSESERPSLRRDISNISTRSHDRRNHHNLPEVLVHEDPIKPYAHDPTQIRQNGHTRSRSSAYTPQTISEEVNDDSNTPITPSDSLSNFEIISPNRHVRKAPSRSKREPSTPVRLKVKAPDGKDTRYIMTDSAKPFVKVMTSIREKFAMTESGWRITWKDDEGDHITLADQEDWEMALNSKRSGLSEESVMKLDLKVQQG